MGEAGGAVRPEGSGQGKDGGLTTAPCSCKLSGQYRAALTACLLCAGHAQDHGTSRKGTAVGAAEGAAVCMGLAMATEYSGQKDGKGLLRRQSAQSRRPWGGEWGVLSGPPLEEALAAAAAFTFPAPPPPFLPAPLNPRAPYTQSWWNF